MAAQGQELRDLIREALQNSMGPDWTCDDGAKAVVEALETANAVPAALDALRRIADAPAWGAPDRWETTPTEVRQLARAALSEASRLRATGRI